jgi:uncharacterized delta-60 repeat protein
MSRCELGQGLLTSGAMLFALIFAGCGGGGGGTPASPVSTGIGAAGGTVIGPSGAKVIVPANALATNTAIAVAQSSAGAPTLPAGVTSVGQMFAFTPHGTSFATPVTITVPFDPALVAVGTTPTLYKTNASMNAWDPVVGATVTGNSMSGQVSGFSYAIVATPPKPPAEGSLTMKTWDLHVSSKSETLILAKNDEPNAIPPKNEPTTAVAQIGDVVNLNFGIGTPITIHPPEVSPIDPNVSAFSDNTGRTFWTRAIAPLTTPGDPKKFDSSSSKLKQVSYYKAAADHPTMKFHVTHATVEAIDQGGNPVGKGVCPWFTANPSAAEVTLCTSLMMTARTVFNLKANSYVNNGTFFDVGGQLYLSGQHAYWGWDSNRYDGASIWGRNNFIANFDADGDGSRRHAKVDLIAPITITVPIDHLKKGDIFGIEITTTSEATNHVQGESFVGAFFRDPATLNGLEVESTGLEIIPALLDVPTGMPPLTCSTGPDPNAGQIQFNSATVTMPEGSNAAFVTVERINGTKGAVSVLLNTSDGSALADSDYLTVAKTLRFADGESGSVVVGVPLVNDNSEEPSKTFTVTLSQPGGCASVGAQASAAVTILDDDQPVVVTPSYAVGGTVTGLTGGGLVLRDAVAGVSLPVANGTFVFPTALVDGSNYDIRIDAQPDSPIQQCAVANGSGTLAGANVTNVIVTCTDLTPSGSLDPTFGTGGRVVSNVEFFSGSTRAPVAMALQSDGRIVLLGGLKLLRFNTDGTLDNAFGRAGVVDVPFTHGFFDTAQDLAVQGDGKIVVVGYTSLTNNSNDDFAVVRFNANGSLDTTFGTAGITTTDFLGSTDQARRVRIQNDGKIVVTGIATFVSGTTGSVSFATARYNSDGTLDVNFGGNGMTRNSPAGSYDRAQGIVIQADSKIVLVGSAANNGVDAPEVGLARLWGDGGVRTSEQPGFLDESFGPLGNGTVASALPPFKSSWQEAVDVVQTADGTLQLACRVSTGATVAGTAFGFVLVAFGSDGHQLTGPLITQFTNQSDVPHAMLLQSDGKIVTVGQSGNLGTNPDMAIVRYAAAGFGIDNSFGTDGKLTIDFFGDRDSAEAVVQQADGKVVVGGYARSSGTNKFAMVRLTQ